MSEAQSILVTGGSGFIGRRLVARLAREGTFRVAVLARGGAGSHAKGVDAIAVPDTQVHSLKSALADSSFDAVIHLAAAGVAPGSRDPATLFAANVAYPNNLLEALAATARPRAFVTVGSCSEYAPSDPVPGGLAEDAALETRRLYGATKAAGTLAGSATAAAFDIPYACLRAFNVYGPGEAAHRLLPSLLQGFATDEKIKLSVGTQLRDFISVDDAVEGLLRVTQALRRDPGLGGIYNICSGRGVAVGDFARLSAGVAGASLDQLDFGAIPLRPDDMMWQVGDNSRLRAAFGWAPSTDLEAGLRQAIAELRHTNAQ